MWLAMITIANISHALHRPSLQATSQLNPPIPHRIHHQSTPINPIAVTYQLMSAPYTIIGCPFIQILEILQMSLRVMVHFLFDSMKVLVEASHLSTNVVKYSLSQVIGSIISMYQILIMKSYSQSFLLIIHYSSSYMDLKLYYMSTLVSLSKIIKN